MQAVSSLSIKPASSASRRMKRIAIADALPNTISGNIVSVEALQRQVYTTSRNEGLTQKRRYHGCVKESLEVLRICQGFVLIVPSGRSSTQFNDRGNGGLEKWIDAGKCRIRNADYGAQQGLIVCRFQITCCPQALLR